MVEVTDGDEEVFALYTALAGSTGPETDTSQTSAGGGDPRRMGTLGFVDSGAATLDVRLEIRPPPGLRRAPASEEPAGPSSQKTGRTRQQNKKEKKKKRQEEEERTQDSVGRTVQLAIKQDVFACAHRPGDTGSLVWRASVDLAELLWTELLFPPRLDQVSTMEPA